MKKKCLIFLLLMSLSQFVFGLNCYYRGYVKKNTKIYYIKFGSITEEEIESADYETFKVIKSVNYSLLAHDKDNVYYNGKLLQDIDAKTFKIIKELKPKFQPILGYGCESSGYIIEDKGKRYELREKNKTN
jgi:hypothetical protein